MAEGSRLDLSLHQVGRIHVLFKTVYESSAQLLAVMHASLAWRPIGPGGESGVVPPVPMPNTAVKRSSAHDTGVTKPRENRPVPGPFGRHTSTRALTDSFAGVLFRGVLFRGVLFRGVLIFVLFAQRFSRAGSSSALRSREVRPTRAVP
jgi:hypothetical protein